MTTPVSSTAARVADPGAGEVIVAAAKTAVRAGTATLAKSVIDAVATSAANELSKAITGEAKKTSSTSKSSSASKTSSASKSSSSSKSSSTKKTSTTTKSTTTKTTSSSKTSSTSKAKGEFAFLDDPSLSTEDKLFRFMQLISKKNDEALVEKMKEFTSKKKSSGGLLGGLKGGLWSVIKAASPGLGALESVLGNDLFKQLGGPALAAAVTALGLPQLAPLAMQLGPQLMGIGEGVIDALESVPVASDWATDALGASGVKSDGKQALSTEEAMELQRMMKKQEEMFTALSNALKSIHDTKMSIISNIR